jgi:hypothetical protein
MKKDFLLNVTQGVIDEIMQLRNDNNTYEQILSKVDISEDKLIKICRNLGLNVGCSTTVKSFDSDEVIAYYRFSKSMRKTAIYFNTSRDTLRKIIPVELRYEKREKLISRSKSVVDWRKRTKAKLVEYKGGKCQNLVCGYNNCDAALEFHHIDPKEKDFSISAKSYSFERLKQEVDKCIMLCSNCHTEVHNGLIKIDENGIIQYKNLGD